jgi:D-alanyl-D-alanine carboxypeptidase/cell division protein FtsN
MPLAAHRLFAAAGMALSLAAGAAGVTTATPAAALGVFSQPKYAAIVVDANTGEVLYSKRADALRYPASITKIMTLYLTFEALATGRLSLHDTVTISPHAYSMMPSKVSNRPGETLTVDQAIQAVTVHSANDVAVALAEKIGGTESHFAELMTLRAHELGMPHSYFVNASGVPDSRQIVTAREIAILSRAVMRDYPQYYAFFGEKSFDYHGKVLINHNHLLMKMPGVDGLKTGFTNAAGFNLAASAVRGGHRLITVVLGGPSTAEGFAVINRRATGQKITIASLISEPDDMSGPIERPPIEEGSADQPGLQVEVQPSMRTLPMMAAARDLSDEAAGAPPAATSQRSAAADDEGCAPVARRGRHHRRPVRAVCATAVAKAKTRAAEKAEKQAAAEPCPTHGRHHHHAACAKAEGTELAKADRAGSEKSHADKKDGGYMIQVGAYKNHALAEGQLGKMASLVDGHATVEHAGGNYRARFLGLSQREAKAACHTLAAKGHPCMVLGES